MGIDRALLPMFNDFDPGIHVKLEIVAGGNPELQKREHNGKRGGCDEHCRRGI